tara:strand:- start:219 stop:764 length:546 start_codon:yes stop_codon:yes gene_type:complete
MAELTSYILDIRTLSIEALQQKYGEFFITHFIEDDELNDSWSFHTRSFSDQTISKIRPLIESGIELDTDIHRFVAFAVQKNAAVQNPWKTQISVGRARNNDIYIRDSSVSKLHCYFNLKDKQLTLQDAGSRNGTRINEIQLQDGDVGEIKDQDNVLIGRVAFTVLNTQNFAEFVRSKIAEA